MSDPHGSAQGSHQDDEPQTPMWLPALGAALFVLVALLWALSPSQAKPAAPAGGQAASAPAH